MSTLRLSRRGLFGGFAALLAAPAIVRVASIMPVKAMPEGFSKAELQAEMAKVWHRYSGYEVLNVSAEDVLSPSHYYWAQHDALIPADASWFRKALAT